MKMIVSCSTTAFPTFVPNTSPWQENCSSPYIDLDHSKLLLQLYYTV